MTTINKELAQRAFQGTSMDPDKRAQRVMDDFKTETAKDYEMLLTHAPTEEKKAILEEEFAKYLGGYSARYNKWLGAHGRCISSFITGPSNFPVRRAERANNVERNRLGELISYREWALKNIKKKLHPEWAPIMAGDGDAQDRLKAKIEKAEERQELMKKVNRIIRKNLKGSSEDKKMALAKEGIPAEIVLSVLTPNCFGCIGFESFELTNNNANIKRMKGRLFNISRNQAKETVKADGVNARYEDCPTDNRVRLFFPGKPDEQIRKELKSAGFRWSPTIGAWQAYRNPWSIDKAKKVAGIA